VTKGGFETAKTSARCRETEEVDLNIVMDAEKRPGGEQ